MYESEMNSVMLLKNTVGNVTMFHNHKKLRVELWVLKVLRERILFFFFSAYRNF